jgi:hypothetical protein
MTGLLEFEKPGGMIRIAENIRSGLVNRNGAAQGIRVRGVTGMNLESFKFI